MGQKLLANELPHVQRYAYDLCKLHDLHRPSHWITLLSVAVLTDCDRAIVLDSRVREQIAQTVGCGPMLVGQAISALTDRGLLVRAEDQRSYRVNASLFGNGQWHAVRRGDLSMVMTIVFSHGGRALAGVRAAALGT